MGRSSRSHPLPKVPWDDLRYLFGEIMYGGHITDDWDRRLCRTYLAEYIRVEMLEGEVLLAPGFQIPPNLDYKVGRGALLGGSICDPVSKDQSILTTPLGSHSPKSPIGC